MIHRELAPNADNALTVDEPLSDLLDMVLASCIMIISRRESKRFCLYSRSCVATVMAIAVSAPSFIVPGLFVGAAGFSEQK
jgi:hypothetical protein